jgi:hypothetical protein
MRLASWTGLGLVIVNAALGTGCVTSAGSPDDGGGGTAGAVGAGGGGEGQGGSGPAGPLTCADVPFDANAATKLVDINEDAVLSGQYLVEKGRVVVTADSVTIEPGTVFYFEADNHISFGWGGSETSVYANGTPQAPILFCARTAQPGFYEGIELGPDVGTDSYLKDVRVEHAGGGEQASVRILGSVLLENVAIVDGESVGLEVVGLEPDTSGLAITGHALEPLLLRGGTAISNLPPGEYTGNGDDRIVVQGFENQDVTFHDHGLPYLQREDRILFGNNVAPPLVTFEPGVEYQFQPDATMVIGWGGGSAEIRAIGTEDKPIRFTIDGGSGVPGSWGGLQIAAGTFSTSTLEHVHIEFGGLPDDANLDVDTSLVVQSSTFANSAGAGIRIHPNAVLLGNGNNTFVGNAEGTIVTD